MSSRAGGGISDAVLNGTQRTIDVYHSIAYQHQTNNVGGNQAYFANGINGRSGSFLNAFFPTGNLGPSGISGNAGMGRPVIYMLGGSNRDMYSLVTPTLRLVRPERAYYDPFAVWEIETHLAINALSAPIADDLGVILYGDTSTTTHGSGFLNASNNPSPGKIGMACMFSGADGALRFYSRSSPVGGVQENVLLDVAGPFVAPRVVRVKWRLESATPARDARMTLFIDDAPKLERLMVSGALVPNVDNMGANNWIGGFRTFLRMGPNNLANTALNFSHWRMSAAPSIAAMG